MENVPRKRLDHRIPFWIDAEAIWFVTVCTHERGRNQLCHPDIGRSLLDSVGHLNRKRRWYCELAVLMPDHAHLLVSLPEESVLSTVVGDWKRWAQVKLKIEWQRNFFDHRIRREESLAAKSVYILQNPVRAGLVGRAEDWPYVLMAASG